MLLYFSLGDRMRFCFNKKEKIADKSYVNSKNKMGKTNSSDVDIAAFTYNDAKYIRKEIQVNNVNLLLADKIDNPIVVNVKTRYSTKSAKATIIQDGDNIKVAFEEPQRAITPGQSAVFYIDDMVLGGGKII